MSCQDGWNTHVCIAQNLHTTMNIYIYIVLNNLPSQVQSQVQTHEQVSGTLRKTCSHQKLSSASIDSFRSELLRPLWSCQDGWNAHVSIAKDVDIYIYICLSIFKSSSTSTIAGTNTCTSLRYTKSKTCSHQNLSSASCSSFSPALVRSCQDDGCNRHVFG